MDRKMTQTCDEQLLALLRYAVGQTDTLPLHPTEEEWQQLYEEACRQSLVGLLFEGVRRLRGPQAPPLRLVLRWGGDADNIAQLNKVCNSEAARLTQLFEREGHATVILKGQANALLYPNPLSRQPGDIDIWVSGGKERVLAMLQRLGLTDESSDVGYHHVHLNQRAQGIEVEVHFLASSGHQDKDCSERLQQYLNDWLSTEQTMVAEGFRVPSMPFALTMQLAHIRHHLYKEGIGLRQLTDYWLLLRHSTDAERRDVASRLQELGLLTVARALMWLIGTLFLERENLLPVPPAKQKGQWMLKQVLRKGNFGHHDRHRQDVLWRDVLRQKLELLPLAWFEPEFIGTMVTDEWHYWMTIVRKLPERIRYHSLSLRDHRDAWGE